MAGVAFRAHGVLAWLGGIAGLALAGLAAAGPEANDESARVARGRYLAEAVFDCQGCHTRRNPEDFSQPIGPEWAGGEEFGAEWLLPGEFITPNITPDRQTGIGNWTTAEIKRAIRDGLNRDGERLFPLMPAHFYRSMSDADLDALVAYLQSLPPRRKPREGGVELDFPRAAIPPLPPLEGPVAGPGDDPLERGRYLLVLANCLTCHSPSREGRLIESRYLAGGVRITAPFGVLSTPNITPDRATGIGDYTEADFIRLMREGIKKDGAPLYLNYMPWYVYRNMTDADLRDMFRYLQSIEAIENNVYDPANQFPLGG